MDDVLNQNKKAWEVAAKHFYGGGVLPSWGSLNEGSDNPGLIGEIEGKVFFEIACGSGHSIQYLIKNGAKKVYGIDISEEQISFARDLNKEAIVDGRVELFCSPMENPVAVPVGGVDAAFSIYGIGWAQDLEKTLQNVYSYLKPGGKLIFSFENPMFARSRMNPETHLVLITGSPYEDYEKKKTSFFGEGANIIYRLPSTWIRKCLQAGFQLTDYFDPKPLVEDKPDSIFGDYYGAEKVGLIAPIFVMSFKK